MMIFMHFAPSPCSYYICAKTMRSEYQQKLEQQQQSGNRHSGPRIVRGGAAGGAAPETPSMRGGGAKLALASPSGTPTVAGGKGNTSGQSSGLLSRLLGGKDK